VPERKRKWKGRPTSPVWSEKSKDLSWLTRAQAVEQEGEGGVQVRATSAPGREAIPRGGTGRKKGNLFYTSLGQRNGASGAKLVTSRGPTPLVLASPKKMRRGGKNRK